MRPCCRPRVGKGRVWPAEGDPETGRRDPSRRDLAVWILLAAATAAITALHLQTPTGGHGPHLAHMVLGRMYGLPLLMAAAWLGTRATLGVAAVATLLFGLHIGRDWSADPAGQMSLLGDVVNLWLLAGLAILLFERLRQLLQGLREAHGDTLDALAASLDLREGATGMHARRVREYSLRLGRRLGLSGSELDDLGEGALLHDVGKIGIPDAILLKPGPLDEEEWTQMRRHPDLGVELVGRVPALRRAAALIGAHHEKFDGSGYPEGLAGPAIPLGARIFAVADALDAMTCDRPYRRALPFDEAARRIEADRGRHFDPRVVDAFLSIPFAEWAEAAARFDVQLRRQPAV